MALPPDKAEVGRRFAGDLRSIREKRGISLEEMVSRIRASPEVLTSFEENVLADHPMYNRVYLRSFAKSYAEVLKLPAGMILTGIDAVLAGRYDRTLAETYLDAPVPRDQPDLPGDARAIGVSSNPENHPVDTGGGTDLQEAPDLPALPPVPEADVGTAAERSGTDVDAPPDELGEQSNAFPIEDAATEVESVDVRPPSQSTDGPAAPKGATSASGTVAKGFAFDAGPRLSDRRWLMWAIPTLIVIAAVLTVLVWPDAEVVAPVEPPPTPVIDSTDVAVSIPRVVLADTMRFTIYALDTLDPVRITVDGGIRAPYWVEAGDSMDVRALASLALEREVPSLELAVQGWRIPLVDVDEYGRIRLTRVRIQALLDSLRLARIPN